MSDDKWTAEDWAAWRRENMRLLLSGWRLGQETTMDGRVIEYAEKDGQRIDRSPKWERDADGNYLYGAP